MKIPDIVPAYLAAVLDEAAATARVKAIRERLDEAAKTENAATGSDRWRAPGYGKSVVRLDGTDRAPQIVVGRDTVFADWLAQREPDLVSATVTAPADQLEGALTALEFAGIPVEASEVKPRSGAATWIGEHCRAFPDVDSEDGAWIVQQVEWDDDGRVIVVEPQVPGLVATRRPPRVVVTIDPSIKAKIMADALAAAGGILLALEGPEEVAS